MSCGPIVVLLPTGNCRCFHAGLAPEELHADSTNITCILSSARTNRLTPETAKSLLHMWRVTRDLRYREMGWSMFQSFMSHSKTPQGAFAIVEVSTYCQCESANFTGLLLLWRCSGRSGYWPTTYMCAPLDMHGLIFPTSGNRYDERDSEFCCSHAGHQSPPCSAPGCDANTCSESDFQIFVAALRA